MNAVILLHKLELCLQLCKEHSASKLIIMGVKLTDGMGHFTTEYREAEQLRIGKNISLNKYFICDYRVKSWTDCQIRIGLSEEELFQLSLLREVQLEYSEYKLLCDIAKELPNYPGESDVQC